MNYSAAIKETLKVANKSILRYRVGAIIYSGKNRSRGCNIEKTHPWLLRDYKRNRISIHAEMVALLKARFSTHGSFMCIMRLDKKGNIMPSKPCSICLGLIKEAGVSQILYYASYFLVNGTKFEGFLIEDIKNEVLYDMKELQYGK